MRDDNMYQNIIAEYLIGMWVGIVFWVLVSVIVCFFCRKNKELRIGGIILIVIAVITVGYGAAKTVLGVVDIKTGDYVTEEVVCSKNRTNHIFLEHPFSITRQDGTSDTLVGADTLPLGEYSGVVTYSKRSKIVLDFKKSAR